MNAAILILALSAAPVEADRGPDGFYEGSSVRQSMAIERTRLRGFQRPWYYDAHGNKWFLHRSGCHIRGRLSDYPRELL